VKIRSNDAILAAVIISIVVHIGLMVFVRQRVMTHVAGSVRSARRAPMQVSRDRETQPPTAVEEILDLEPVREEPAARPAEMPAVTAVGEVRQLPAAVPEVPANVPADLLPVARFDESSLSTKPSPTPVMMRLETPAARESSDFTVLPATGDPAPVVIPVVPVVPTMPLTAASLPSAPKKVDPPSDAPKFTPAEEVYEEVDHKIIEAEKAAVKALVNSDSAEELAPYVDLKISKCETGDGMYFRMVLTPRTGLRTVPKDVVLILDASGSIGGDRMGSIRKAAKRILRSCANTGDRFNLVAFRDRYQYAFRTWQECTQKSFDRSDAWLNNLAAHGRTDVFTTVESILTLPRDPRRPLIALLVTDGDANSGISHTADIVSKFTEMNDGLVSVYMYGVKSSANRELMEGLTRGNRGESFVFEGFRWSAGDGLEGLSERFRDPLLSDMRVVFASGTEAEVYPRRLRNLYRGGQVELLGRVPPGVRKISFSLKGLNGERAYESFFTQELGEAGVDPGLPAAWLSERSFDFKTRKVK